MARLVVPYLILKYSFILSYRFHHNNSIKSVYIAAVRLLGIFVVVYPRKVEMPGMVGTAADEAYPRKTEMPGMVGTAANEVYPPENRNAGNGGYGGKRSVPPGKPKCREWWFRW